MALIYRKHKGTGTVYVYESKPYWDREKKQTRSTRVCIGKLDEKGELILSARFSKPLPDILTGGNTAWGGAPRRLYAGAVYLLDRIGQAAGFRNGLEECFPSCFRLLLSVVYFLILEGGAPISRIGRWSLTHAHPAREPLSPAPVFSLLASLPEESMRRFLAGREKQCPETAGPVPAYPPRVFSSAPAPGEKAVCGMGFAVLSAAVLLSDVLSRMAGNAFFSGWTAQQVFDCLDTIECCEGTGGRPRMGFVSSRQNSLYRELGVEPPASFAEIRPAG